MRCGAPLVIPNDPPARPLDVTLDLDRRALRETVPGPIPAGKPPRPQPSPGAPTAPPRGSAPQRTVNLDTTAPVRAPAAPSHHAPPVKPPVRPPGPALAPPVRPPAGATRPPPVPAPRPGGAPPIRPRSQPTFPAQPAPPREPPRPQTAQREHAADFLAPPTTPVPAAPAPRAPPQHPPPSRPPPLPPAVRASAPEPAPEEPEDPFAFTDLPDDDPPELAQPPSTSEADDAFAALTARVRAGYTPPPVARAPVARSPAQAARPAAVPAAGQGDVPDAEIEAIEVHLRRPAPWRRALAWLLDGVPFALASAGLGAWVLSLAEPGRARPASAEGVVDLLASHASLLPPLAGVLAVALFTYATLAHALAGATFGKWVAGIRVVGPDGARPSLARSATRSALSAVSLGLLGLGFLVALFDRTGRALHDLVARTWVVEAP